MIQKWLQVRSIASFVSINTSTEQGRSDERHRRILLTAAASALAKIVSAGTVFISIPLTLHYLGVERFGMWMTISSVIALLAFADLGIGNGLLNAISEANGRDDQNAIRRYISSALVILGGIAVLILLGFYLIYPLVPWADFLNVKSDLAIRESSVAIAVFVLCFALNIPAGIIQRVQMGLQMGFVSNLWQAAGSILGLIAVLLVIHFEMGLPWLVGGIAGAPILVASLNGIFFFTHVKPELKPGLALICRTAMKKIAHTGLLFLVLQIAVAVAFASDNIVIARLQGAEAVAQYAVPEKMFSVIPILLGLVLMPLWPAYGEAISRGDGGWVKKIFKRSLLLSLLFSLVSAVVLIFGAHTILPVWVGHEVVPSFLLLFGLGLWKVCEACGMALAIFLNGANIVRFQVIPSVLLAVTVIPLKILLIEKMGIAGTVWATIIAYSLFILLPYTFFFPKIWKRITDDCQGKGGVN